MLFYYLVVWYFVLNSSILYADDFRLDDYEDESRRWKDPHADVFAYSEPETVDKLSELSGSARGAVECDKLHAAIEACYSNVIALNRQVRNSDVTVQRLIKHLVKIYDESIEYSEGIIHMQLSAEDKKLLKAFANDGKFSSHIYNNVLDLLKKSFTVPSKSLLDKVLPPLNFFVTFPLRLWNGAMNCFQETRFLLMQFVFSSDVTTYATMILPPMTFFLALRSGRSAMTGVMLAAIAVGFISYFVELRSAIEIARAKDLARMARSRHMPPECKAAEDLEFYEWSVTWVRSFFRSSDRCEHYFRDQIPESSIEPSEVFWKILFTPITVCMDKFGHGLRSFVGTFGKDLGWVSSVFVLPLGVIALLWFLALLLSFISGGALTLPLLGKISFSNPFGHRYNPTILNAHQKKGTDNSTTTALTPAVSNNYNIQVFNAPHPSASQITSHPGLNMSIAVPSGPTFQLMSSPTSETNHNLQITGQEPTFNVIQQPQSTTGNPKTNNESGRDLEQAKPIAALPETSRSSASASQCPRTLVASTSEREPRPPFLVRGFSEIGHHRGYEMGPVSRHCALKEIGAGDYLPRDLTHPMLPSGVIRWRHHQRKLSL